MEILKVYVSLYPYGWKITVDRIECEEKQKIYQSYNQKIKKDKLMKIDTIFIESHRNLSYFTFCLPSQKDEAILNLKSHISGKVLEYKSKMDDLLQFIETATL